MRTQFAVSTVSGSEIIRFDTEFHAAEFAGRVNQTGGYAGRAGASPEPVTVRPIRVPGTAPRPRNRDRSRFGRFAPVAALALALAAGLVSAPVDAAPGPRLSNPGTPDAAVLIEGRPVQLQYIGVYRLSRAGLIDCVWFEDGSAYCGPAE